MPVLLTDEQQYIVDHAVNNRQGPLKVPAGAGCGKTYTLTHVARALHAANLRVAYLAFNRAMADEAKSKFEGIAKVYTTHGLPFRQLGIGRISRKRKLGSIYPWQAAEALNLGEVFYGVPKNEYGAAVLQVMNHFFNSGESFIDPENPDCLPASVKRKYRDQTLLETIASHAQDLFFMISPDEENTQLPLPHDAYLKYWQVIGAPGLEEFDVILLDEAQDSNPVVLEALRGQRVIYVGDSHQSIYSFRNAIDAMSIIDAPETPLTQSFRFGPVIANLANAILQKKKINKLKYPLRGLSRLNTEIISSTPPLPYTRIYRTNYQLIRDSVVLSDRGHNIVIVGDMSELVTRITSALALRDGDRRNIRDPLIRSFSQYDDLDEAADRNNDLGRELRQVVRIIDEFGDRQNDILALLKNKRPADSHSIIMTTAHKSKGREWEHVALMSDFDQTLSAENEFDMRASAREEELNLLYVAATRATSMLHIQGEYLQNIARNTGLLNN